MTYGIQKGTLSIYVGTIEETLYNFYLNCTLRIGEEFGKQVLIISLRKSLQELTETLISMKTDVEFFKLATANLEYFEWKLVQDGLESLSSSELTLVENISSIEEIKKSIIQDIKSNNTKLVIIDSIEYIQEPELPKHKIIEILKHISKELNVSILITCLIDYSNRIFSNPSLNLIPFYKESKLFIDRVFLGYPPEFYGVHVDTEGNSLKGIFELHILKNNYGEVGKVQLRFNKRTKKISDTCDDFAKTITDNIINIDEIPF